MLSKAAARPRLFEGEELNAINLHDITMMKKLE